VNQIKENTAGRKITISPNEGNVEVLFFPEDKLTKEEIDTICELVKNTNLMQIENYEEYDEDGNPIETNEDWKNVALDISKFPTKKFSDLARIPFEDVNKFVKMEDGNEGYLASYSELSYYAYKYQQFTGFHPHVYRFEQFNMNKFIIALFKTMHVPIHSYIKASYQGSDNPRITSIAMLFSKDIFMYLDGEDKAVIYYNPKDENDENSLFYSLICVLKSYRRPKVTKNKIYIVYRSSHGFDKKGFDVKKINVDLQENYNEGFVEMSEEIISGLNKKNKTNLVILSGEPGTGKTTFIRYLTSKVKKNIIFISPDMVDSITDPGFIPFLMSNNDSILIIEDAEPALEKRNNGGRSSAVSNVLNLTDGLLSDCLRISIVATFNTDKKTLDEALLRKGRLLMNYKFDKLDIAKSKALLEKLGHKEVEVTEPMTLADIYFFGTDNNVNLNKPTKIGFK
jgi:broad-specificity NMP kinase